MLIIQTQLKVAVTITLTVFGLLVLVGCLSSDISSHSDSKNNLSIRDIIVDESISFATRSEIIDYLANENQIEALSDSLKEYRQYDALTVKLITTIADLGGEKELDFLLEYRAAILNSEGYIPGQVVATLFLKIQSLEEKVNKHKPTGGRD